MIVDYTVLDREECMNITIDYRCTGNIHRI